MKAAGPLTARLPRAFSLAARRHGVRLTRDVLWVNVQCQCLWWFVEPAPASHLRRTPVRPVHVPRRRFLVSTSKFGLGQQADSDCTPLGLHRIAEKIGGGWPVGAVFKSRKRVGFTWLGCPDATIAHRILWLEGLEPGFNRGGKVDTKSRYIYIHGLADEPSLGRPASHGCIHLAAKDLFPLFDRIPVGTLVWISAG